MYIALTPEQVSVLDAQQYANEKRAFLTQALSVWTTHFPRLMPGAAPLPEHQVRALMDKGYELCAFHGPHDRPLVLHFIFSILRAAHLGCSSEFMQGLCRYFVQSQGGHELALRWIGYVLSGNFQRDLPIEPGHGQ